MTARGTPSVEFIVLAETCLLRNSKGLRMGYSRPSTMRGKLGCVLGRARDLPSLLVGESMGRVERITEAVIPWI